MPTETKLFEVRDDGTTIPCLAVQIEATNDASEYVLRRGGFGVGTTYVLLTNLNDYKTSYDPYDWRGRTMHNAHLAIERNWDAWPSGSVVDVQHILGETDAPKLSEAIR